MLGAVSSACDPGTGRSTDRGVKTVCVCVCVKMRAPNQSICTIGCTVVSFSASNTFTRGNSHLLLNLALLVAPFRVQQRRHRRSTSTAAAVGARATSRGMRRTVRRVRRRVWRRGRRFVGMGSRGGSSILRQRHGFCAGGRVATGRGVGSVLERLGKPASHKLRLVLSMQ